MKKFITRTLTGAIYVALIVCSLIIESPILFEIVFPVFIILGIKEFLSLTDKKGNIGTFNKLLDIAGGLILFFSINLKVNHPEIRLEIAAPYLGYLIIKTIYQLYVKTENLLENWAFSLMGQLYVALPLSLLNIIYTLVNPQMLLAIFLFIWLNDTGAYCIGTLFGKHRLFERISPKKSWEGFWGGLVLCIISSVCFSLWLNTFFNGPELMEWVILSILVSVFSTFGDLSESLIKRLQNVKDSGNMLPGHGGILDRIDSLLMVTPITIIYFIAISIL